MGSLAPIRARAASAPGSVQRLVEHLLADPAATARLTAAEVAAEIGTSESTVIRAAQRLGFAGYTELRMELAGAQPAALLEYDEIDFDDAPADLLAKVAAASSSAITGAFATVDADAFDRAVGRIATAPHVVCVAAGTSAAIALDGAYRLRAMGVRSSFNLETFMQHTDALAMAADDYCLAVSHTGVTNETLHAMEAARATGAGVGLITSFYDTPAAELATELLVTGPTYDGREGSMATRIAHMSLIDAVLIGVSLRDPERSERRMNHWVGAVEEHRRQR